MELIFAVFTFCAKFIQGKLKHLHQICNSDLKICQNSDPTNFAYFNQTSKFRTRECEHNIKMQYIFVVGTPEA